MTNNHRNAARKARFKKPFALTALVGSPIALEGKVAVRQETIRISTADELLRFCAAVINKECVAAPPLEVQLFLVLAERGGMMRSGGPPR